MLPNVTHHAQTRQGLTHPSLARVAPGAHQRVPVGARVDRPVLPAARRATADRLAVRANRRRRPQAAAGVWIHAGQPPRRVRRALPAWSCRATYAALITRIATTPECRDLCKQHQIALQTWVAVMTAAALAADTATGMCWATQETIAATVNRRAKVVQRAFTIARALGMALEVYRGRELGREERLQLHRDSAGAGHPQRGIPSGWQLAVIPPATAAKFSTPHPGRFTYWSRFDHLPLWGQFSTTSHLGHHHLCALTGTTEPASRARPQRKRARVDPAAWSMAAELLRRLPWLAGERTGRLAPCLHRFATATTPWTALDVIDALGDQATRTGRDFTTLNTATIRTRPVVLLAGLLRTLDEITDYPGPAFAPELPTTAGLPVLVEHPTSSTDTDHDQLLTGQACHQCGARRGRDRALPLTTVVCDACWHTFTHHTQHTLAAQPCGDIGCDTGWRTTPTGDAYPCQECPPSTRLSSRDHAFGWTGTDQDPPF